MTDLTVHTKRPYRILMEKGCLGKTGEYAARLFPERARTVLVTDSHVGPLYAEKAAESLREAGFQVSGFQFPAGEKSKTLSTVEEIYGAFAKAGLTRGDFAVALGGGVTGDTAGFAAATWMRGIPFLQIPTSLLAQIDSSVGGKTGVDLPQGKNLIGSFHQPALVLIDPLTLKTLPDQFFTDGMGEAIKYGCIQSRDLFGRIQDTDVRKNPEPMIMKCIEIKRRAVENDEFDRGGRMLLNFGHTFGHALETLHGFRGLTHGAAVGIGMVMMARFGEALGATRPGTSGKIAAALQKYGLPLEDSLELGRILRATASDKKRRGNQITLVLLRQIGEGFLDTMPYEKFRTEASEALR